MDIEKALRRRDPTAAILLARPTELGGLRTALGCQPQAAVEEVAAAYQLLAADGDPMTAALKAMRRSCDSGDAVQAALTLLHPGDGNEPLTSDEFLQRAGKAANSRAVQAAFHAADIRIRVYCRLTRRNANNLLREITVSNNKQSSWSIDSLLQDAVDWVSSKALGSVGDMVKNINIDDLLKTFNTDKLETVAKEEAASLSKFNVLIAGQTGAGKSTLINAIFGESLAKAGMGKPVTQETTAYEREGIPFCLWDTMGLEMEAFERTLNAIREHVNKARNSSSASDHLHVIWLCIEETNLKVQDGHRRLIELANSSKIPVIVVLTKMGSHPEFVDVVRQELPAARDVVRVRSIETRYDDQVFPPKGLDDLINATRAVLPDGVKAAFDAAQQRQIQRKFENAEDLPLQYAGMAAGAAAVPIPMAAAAAVIPFQLKMIAAINGTLGIEVAAENWKPLTVAVLSALGLTALGRLAVVSLLEFIPGLGSLAGGAINAGMAGAMTYGLGHGYIAFVKHFHEQKGRLPEASEVVDGFKDFWARYDNKAATPKNMLADTDA